MYDVSYSRAAENYELAYRIYEKNGQLIVIILAGTRENFYDELNTAFEFCFKDGTPEGLVFTTQSDA